MKTLTTILAVFLLGFQIVTAQEATEHPAGLEAQLKKDPGNPELLLKLGRIYHNLGAGGDEDAVDKAAGYLERLIELKPDHAGAHCWYGSVLTMKGRDAWFPLSKVNYVNRGIAEMDKAVSLDPKNFYLRIARAANGLALPDMFNRLEIVVSDYEHLKKMEKEKPGTLNSQTHLSVFFNLGRAYERQGDSVKSRQNLNQIIETSPDSEIAKSSRELLAKLDAKEKQ